MRTLALCHQQTVPIENKMYNRNDTFDLDLEKIKLFPCTYVAYPAKFLHPELEHLVPFVLLGVGLNHYELF